MLKGVGVPEYYLGGNVQCVKYAYPDINITHNQWTSVFIAQTYIERLTERAVCLIGLEKVDKLQYYNDPMEFDYHPDTDDTLLLSGDHIYKYRMLIGSVLWAMNLGWYDVMYAMVTLASYNMETHSGH